ncbi:hypothetical protein SKAU_G00194530 [Synaphobranchus kaupii]|uniref:Uncharacterized protein n=1 Tax=Synaphobranchus kaupii TaxID=118154 RepID=A0A9Q1FEA6_SYNKA|nr:hypothetical protein SKAU_G00194530 [Synaphobranchus kaupii]
MEKWQTRQDSPQHGRRSGLNGRVVLIVGGNGKLQESRESSPFLKGDTQLHKVLRRGWSPANTATQDIPDVLDMIHVGRIWRPIQNIYPMFVQKVHGHACNVRMGIILHKQHPRVVGYVGYHMVA